MIYIFILIFIVFIVLENVLQTIEEPIDDDEHYLSYLEEELATLDYHSVKDNEYFIDIKTQYEILKIQHNYPKDSWQYAIFDHTDIFYSVIRIMIENTYGLLTDEQQLQTGTEKLATMLKKLEEGNWKYFLEDQLQNVNEQIFYYQEQLKTIENKKTIEELNTTIAIEKINKQALEWRIDKEILYGNSFLSQKIDEYIDAAPSVFMLKNKENKNLQEELEYRQLLKQMHTSQYYIENNIHMEKEYNARYILMNTTEEYGIFVIIFSIIMSGTIVSNELQKGTIKLLLTKPFSRGKILLSKYIVSILCIFILSMMMHI